MQICKISGLDITDIRYGLNKVHLNGFDLINYII